MDDGDDDRLERETTDPCHRQRRRSRSDPGNHQRIVIRNHDDDDDDDDDGDDDDDDERAPERVGQTLLYFWGDQGGVDAPRSGEESGGASVRW